jgi:flagellar basal-body rod modification protein FlgD
MSSIGLEAVSSREGQTSSITTNNSTLGKDDFLTLLVAQLQNQDPLNPMEGTDFTAQLAQFSSLEQLQNMNTNLESMHTTETIQTYSNAVSFIGKTVTALGNQIYMNNGQSEDIQCELSENAAGVFVSIYDENGNFIQDLEYGAMAAGIQRLSWDGNDYLGNQSPDGKYQYSITALDADGEEVDVSNFTTDTVTGVNYKDGQAYLITANQEIPMGDIVQVMDAQSD